MFYEHFAKKSPLFWQYDTGNLTNIEVAIEERIGLMKRLWQYDVAEKRKSFINSVLECADIIRYFVGDGVIYFETGLMTMLHFAVFEKKQCYDIEKVF